MDISKKYKARPRRWYAWDYVLFDGTKKIAEIVPAMLKTKATASVDGVTHQMYRERALKGAFLLELDGQILARALKPSMFKDEYTVGLNDQEFVLKQTSFWRTSFSLFSGRKEVGTIVRDGVFTRAATLKLPQSLSVPSIAMVFWLVLLTWQRQSRAVAG